jgi:GxxExxY protein
MLIEKDLTSQVIGAAIEVHLVLGPGLLESAYQACMCQELTLRKLSFEQQNLFHLSIKAHYSTADIAWILS